MDEWVWSNGGMILTGENWSTGRKTLYSVDGRWMNEYGAMVEWYWNPLRKIFRSVTSSNTNLTWTELWLNPSLRYEKPVNEHLKTKIILNYFNNSFLYSALQSVYSSKPMITIYTTGLIFSNSTFCPHSIFMWSMWIWEKTAIISLYSINWLVFVTEI